MKTSSYDEYEEVESPFAARPSDTSSHRERLRPRKNVINRPFGADPSVAPAVVENYKSRRSIGHAGSAELIDHRKSELAHTEIEYLDEEFEEEIEKRPARSSSPSKKSLKKKKNLLSRLGWGLVALLVLRLICMDRGVWDFFSTENAIQDKREELKSIQAENNDLRTEISRIQLDKNYQRHLTKEHLGVIAVDEFLVLFANESVDPSQSITSKDL